MDEDLFALAESQGMPAAIFKETGTAGRVATRWKYFRMDPRAFMSMGILKVRFFMEFLAAGFDVLCADLDVLWLRDPRPWLSGGVLSGGGLSGGGGGGGGGGGARGGDAALSIESSLLLGFADVVVSTDVTGDLAEDDRNSWGINNEMNTGMLLMRSTVGAMAVCRAWVDRMQLEMVKIEKLPKNMLQASLTSLTPRFAHPLHAHSSHSSHALLPTCHTPSFAYFCSPVVE
jgi:hypothetical protein